HRDGAGDDHTLCLSTGECCRVTMAQRLALSQGQGGVNPRHNLFFSKTQIFWPKGNFFFHAKGTAGELQIGRLLDELDGGGLFIKRETPNGRTEKRPRAGYL
ncbi:hypothetical protein AAIG83_33365, partial [Pseudomonas aeruginosa]